MQRTRTLMQRSASAAAAACSTSSSASAVVVGVANQRSLAWSAALSLLNSGNFGHVVVTYQNERFQNSVEAMVKKQNDLYQQQQSDTKANTTPYLSCLPCDVTDEEEVRILFDQKIPSLLLDTCDGSTSSSSSLDALVHSVAYAPAEAMKSATSSLPLTMDTSRESFELAHSISSYSLITLSKYALPLLSCQNNNDDDDDNDAANHRFRSPSITTLTHLGSTRAVQNYNVMGPAKASLEALVRGLALELSPEPHRIRVNAVSAGPINTLAARGIRDFGKMRHEAEERSFLKRSVTSEEVGNVVDFVASSRASGITGQVLFCDGGYSAMGG